jgi:oligopeptide/dipeptide ABC transporter ATP-binding protein
MRVGSIVAEPLEVHSIGNRASRRKRVGELLERVGLRAGDSEKYPHEFSGGQRQRIGIARAIGLEPRFIVLDEPVSALDVSVQAQVLNLLDDLRRDLGLTYLFIAHNLAVVARFSDRVAVMYLGRIVEIGPSEALFGSPQHPYTQALLAAVPGAGPSSERAAKLVGDLPSPLDPPEGCAFHPRCAHATAECREKLPLLRRIDGARAAHFVACHHAERISASEAVARG